MKDFKDRIKVTPRKDLKGFDVEIDLNIYPEELLKVIKVRGYKIKDGIIYPPNLESATQTQ